ncbi:MAG: hypothetical protein HDT43_02840, partial [Ruminococcaceae bacterium]|nr:hypothetical protein [Oscillospiraceae bacterium]
MKKIFAVIFSALMLAGCAENNSGNEIVFGVGDSETKGADMSSTESSTITESSSEVEEIQSVFRLTEKRSSDYVFSVRGEDGEITDITDGVIIDELWDYLWETERQEPLSNIPEGADRQINYLPTDELILKSKSDDKEYTVRAGYTSDTFSNGADVIIDTPAVIIEGIEYGGENFVCYEDFLGVEHLFDGLYERAKSGNYAPERRDKEKITLTRFEDCEFTGTAVVYEYQTRTHTKYSGALTDEASRELWELIAEIESTEPIVFDEDDSVGGGSFNGELIIRNDRAGRSWRISDGILYENPIVEGGTGVLVIGDKCYYPSSVGGDNSSYNRLTELITEGISRGENIVWRETAEQSSDIVLIDNYRNFAWGYQNSGTLVDIEGNIYEFDLTDIDPVSEEEFVNVLEYRLLNGLLGEPV